ncbi:MAG: MarR family winged helix-turn-helix transcriptional regulator [Qingshengfaniella sp.]
MEYWFTDSLPYLLNRVGVALGETFSKRIAPYGVTLPMYRVLAILRQTGPKSLGELSTLVSVEMSTLSRLIGTMVKAGHVTRNRPPENGRVVSIAITDQGAALADDLMKLAMQVEMTLLSGLDTTEAETLKSLMRQISRRVTAL